MRKMLRKPVRKTLRSSPTYRRSANRSWQFFMRPSLYPNAGTRLILGTVGDQLLKKNIFVAVGVVPRVAFVCEVHPAVLAERTRLLPALREAAESANEFPSVQQRASGWIVV